MSLSLRVVRLLNSRLISSCRAVIIGCPPAFRGSTEPGRDLELQLIKYFPGVPLFVEKPVATGPRGGVEHAFAVAKAIDDSGAICSVG
jgi:Oxidoreductase family, NAD-binding Rossmann fold